MGCMERAQRLCGWAVGTGGEELLHAVMYQEPVGYMVCWPQGEAGSSFYVVERGELSAFKDGVATAIKAYGPGACVRACALA